MDNVVSLQAEWPLMADLAGRARMADLGVIAGEGKGPRALRRVTQDGEVSIASTGNNRERENR